MNVSAYPLWKIQSYLHNQDILCGMWEEKKKKRECQNLANPKDLKQHPETAESTR